MNLLLNSGKRNKMHYLKQIPIEKAELLAGYYFRKNNGRYKIILPESIESAASIVKNRITIPLEEIFGSKNNQETQLIIIQDVIAEEIPSRLKSDLLKASQYTIDSIQPFVNKKLVPSNINNLEVILEPMYFYLFLLNDNKISHYREAGNISNTLRNHLDKYSLERAHKATEIQGILSTMIVSGKNFYHYLTEPAFKSYMPRLIVGTRLTVGMVESAIHETVHAIIEPTITKKIIRNYDERMDVDALLIHSRPISELFAHVMTPYIARECSTEYVFGDYLKVIQENNKNNPNSHYCNYGQVEEILKTSKNLKEAFHNCLDSI